MKVLNVRNVHESLPRALKLIEEEGIRRESRNGPVLQCPTPVTTVYDKPSERVIFWPQRDANPFFHLYEALWMLAGRNDLAGPVKYNKNFASYSDDGKILHAPYGHRWRQHFTTYYDGEQPIDQLPVIVENLKKDSTDRRSVLQMWNPEVDLGRQGKDLPCNLTATFQISHAGYFDMTIFCRSNDIIWGAYGANAVHFSVLQEYLAAWIGCPVGRYYQISVNWHAYLETLTKLADLPRPDKINFVPNPYENAAIGVTPMFLQKHIGDNHAIHAFDDDLKAMLTYVDNGCVLAEFASDFPFLSLCYELFSAHHSWRTLPAPDKFGVSIERVWRQSPRYDWVVACMQWLSRRKDAWEKKQNGETIVN